MAKSLRYWYRQKYQLPPNDPRYLEITDLEITGEFYADRFFKVLQKGRMPTVDEFDTDYLDDEIDRWEAEDEKAEELRALIDDPDEWEVVKE